MGHTVVQVPISANPGLTQQILLSVNPRLGFGQPGAGRYQEA